MNPNSNLPKKELIMLSTSRSPLVLASLLAIALAGCASQAAKEEAEAAARPAATDQGADANKVKPAPAEAGKALPPAASEGARTDGGMAAPKALESIGAPGQRSGYFEFDKYDIRTDFKTLVADHGKFTVGKKDAKMLIQGNADERGSREYNLALGQRRADAVKRALLLQGVKEEQVESVSLGEEKPKATGHDEASWAENRRADILYKGEY
jgi:peptidoglycan-associated lipoprotein